MSTALSPDCTPPKLLEKFTEAERFDLALDVSMKLGWDVLPLWKTWAMRCLTNRNFPEARKKFRHCFQTIRSQHGRCSLLSDILNVLTRMEESKLPLGEEIELIKQGKSPYRTGPNDLSEPVKMDRAKPKIFEECLNYLREYGNSAQMVKFYVDNQLWTQAIEILESRPELTRLFISDVLSCLLVTGHLDDFVSSSMQHDPTFEKTGLYFETIYRYCSTQRRHNILYFIQNKIGDYVAAAENQVTNFFLKKPTIGYKELNLRLTNLTSACDNYREHLARMERIREEDSCDVSGPDFFTRLSINETQARLDTLNTQLDITRNFAINEVSGCINGIEVVFGAGQVNSNEQLTNDDDDELDTSPVTLFDRGPRRRTFLAALVMTYYDTNCDTCFSDSGFELANRLINEFGLDKLQVFKTAMRIIMDDESFDIVENANSLLKRLNDDYLACTRRLKKKREKKSSSDKPDLDKPRISCNESDAVIARPLGTTKGRRRSQLKATRQSEASDTGECSPYSFKPKDKNVLIGSNQAARLLCDEVIRDAIRSYREPDYSMELSKLLSAEARIELNIELGKLSVAQRLAFDMEREDYVVLIVQEAERLNQHHIKDVCQQWLSKRQH